MESLTFNQSQVVESAPTSNVFANIWLAFLGTILFLTMAVTGVLVAWPLIAMYLI